MKKNAMNTERQQEIIDVSLELIDAKGIQGLTIRNLALKIGITEPAIYRHFKTKTDILVAILEFFRSGTLKIFEGLSRETIPATEKINKLFKGHFSAFASNPALTSVIFSEEIFRNEILLTDRIKSIIGNNSQILVSIIKQGQVCGEIRNDIEPDYLATIIMGTLRLFVKKWQFSNYTFDIEKEGERIIDAMQLLIRP